MISKVAKGQSITAAHNNQIVDAINQFDKSFSEYKGIDYSSPDAVTNPVLDLIAIPSPCSDSVYLAYFNSQNSLDNIVKYNGEWATYCIPSALKQTLAGLQALETIDYCTNYYNIGRQLTLDTQCADNTINLTIFKEKDSECSESSESECSKPTYFYTLADKTSICSLGDDYVILDSYSIGCFKNGEIAQIHEGLLIDSNTTNTDTLIPDLQLSSITIEEYIDEETKKAEKYLTLFNFCESFGDAIEERDFTKRQNDEYKVLLSKKDGEKITLTYGEPDKHFILNDLSAVEPGDFVLPRSLSSVQNIVVGLGLPITPPTGTEGTENTEGTEGEDACVQYEIATICFTNPYKEQDPCGCSTTDYGILSGDWVFSLDKDDKSGIFKRYRPISICENLENDHLCVLFKKEINEYQIFGPNMVLEKISPPTEEENTEGTEGEEPKEVKEGFEYNEGENKWTLTLLKTDLSAGCYIQIEEDEKTKIPVINGPNMVYKELDKCSDITDTQFKYDCASHTWTLSAMPHSKAGEHLKQDFNIINGPSIEFGEVGPNATTNASYSDEDNKWTLDIKTLEGSGLSAGTFIKLDEQKDKPTVINGPNIVLKPIDPCDTNQSNRAEYVEDSHQWDIYFSQSGLEAGDYIQINDGKIDGPNIKVEKGDELKAEYNPHEWTITVPENVSDLSAGNYIDITNNQINGAKIVFKQHGCNGNPTTNGTATHDATTNTWTLDVNAEGTLEAGQYIKIENNQILGPAIEVTKGDKLDANYTDHKWTITVPENVSDLSAGQYITITDNSINGANIVIDSGCGKIPGTATYANGTWTISLPKSGEVDFDGVKSLNGLKDEVTIASNTLNVTQSGQNINIEFPDEGVQYDFDEEWFIVTGNKVTINECAVAAVAKTVIPDIEASITPTVTMSIDEVSDGKRNRCGDIMATITNSSAFSATARFTTSWRQ
jgi:hypothetical protein